MDGVFLVKFRQSLQRAVENSYEQGSHSSREIPWFLRFFPDSFHQEILIKKKFNEACSFTGVVFTVTPILMHFPKVT